MTVTPATGSPLRLAAVGDVFLDRPDPGAAFAEVTGIFAAADIVFGNSEGVYAADHDRAPSAGVAIIAAPTNAAPLGPAGFTVMSLANNHILDGGHRGLEENNRLLRDQGIVLSGAGHNLAAAREPAIIEHGGRRVAFLSYSSTFPAGYEARAAVPGLAPLRAYNLYRPYEAGEWSPGLLPQVVTVPHELDFARLAEDISAARDRADLVMVSVHAGDFTRPFVVSDHERYCARFAVDAGADAYLGHHHHLLRGFEFYRGKPVCYGLGHFAFDLPDLDTRLAAEGYLGESSPEDSRAARRRAGDYRLWPQPGYPLLPFHPDARMTLIAILDFHESGARLGFVPVVIGPDGTPRPHRDTEQDGQRVIEYVESACRAGELPVIVKPAALGDIDGWPIHEIVPAP